MLIILIWKGFSAIRDVTGSELLGIRDGPKIGHIALLRNKRTPYRLKEPDQMSHDTISRRRLLKGALLGLAAAPAASLLSREAYAANPLIDPADPQAKALGYLHDATKVDAKANPNYKPGQRCDNCIQYTGKAGEAEGGCNIFPGKNVKAAGWCKVYVIKPGATLG